MKNRYTVRIKKGEVAIVTTVTDYVDLMDFLETAKGCIIETKIFENMPVEMHNAIGAHNKETRDNQLKQ